MNAFSSIEPAWKPLMACGDHPLIHIGATPESVAKTAAGLVYIATPYSKVAVDEHGNWSWHGSASAMERASRVAAQLAKRGVSAVSPIVLAADMCHTDATLDPLDATFWTSWCAPLIDAARSVVVPDIPGWDRSFGIWHEVGVALAANKAIHIYADAT